jgi:hypothetical protein
MNLTEHVTLEELIASDYALRHGINNMPVDHTVLSNLHTLAHGLERVRHLFMLPLLITSGYRGFALNVAVGGSSKSDHLKGLAADFHVPGITPREVCQRIIAHPGIGWSKLIYEGTWTHIAFPEEGHEAERMVLTAIFKPGQKATYVKGIV